MRAFSIEKVRNDYLIEADGTVSLFLRPVEVHFLLSESDWVPPRKKTFYALVDLRQWDIEDYQGPEFEIDNIGQWFTRLKSKGRVELGGATFCNEGFKKVLGQKPTRKMILGILDLNEYAVEGLNA